MRLLTDEEIFGPEAREKNKKIRRGWEIKSLNEYADTLTEEQKGYFNKLNHKNKLIQMRGPRGLRLIPDDEIFGEDTPHSTRGFTPVPDDELFGNGDLTEETNGHLNGEKSVTGAAGSAASAIVDTLAPSNLKNVIAPKAKKLAIETGRAITKIVDNPVFNQFSKGGQEGIINLAELIDRGVNNLVRKVTPNSDLVEPYEGELYNQMRADLDERIPVATTKIGKLSNIVGELLTPSPVGVGQATELGMQSLTGLAKRSLQKNDATNTAVKAVIKASKKGIQSIGKNVISGPQKFIIGQATRSYNQTFKNMVEDTPEILFKPRRIVEEWQDEIKNALTTAKGSAGIQIKELTDEAIKHGIDDIDSLGIQSQLTDVLGTISESASGIKKVVGDSIRRIKGDGHFPTKGTSETVLTPTRVKGVSKIGLEKPISEGGERISVDGLAKVRQNFADNRIYRRIRDRQSQGLPLEGSDGAVLQAKKIIDEAYKDLLTNVDNRALTKKLIKSKGEYRDIKILEGVLGNINEGNILKTLEESMSFGNALDLDAFRKVFPKDLIDEGVSHVFNKPKELSTIFQEAYSFGKRHVGRTAAAATGKTRRLQDVEGKIKAAAIGVSPKKKIFKTGPVAQTLSSVADFPSSVVRNASPIFKGGLLLSGVVGKDKDKY